jgi:hypothetical protein
MQKAWKTWNYERWIVVRILEFLQVKSYKVWIGNAEDRKLQEKTEDFYIEQCWTDTIYNLQQKQICSRFE